MKPAPQPAPTGKAHVDTFNAPPRKQAMELWAETGGQATIQGWCARGQGARRTAADRHASAGGAVDADARLLRWGRAVVPGQRRQAQLKADRQKVIDNLPTSAPDVKTDPEPAPVIGPGDVGAKLMRADGAAIAGATVKLAMIDASARTQLPTRRRPARAARSRRRRW